MPDAPGAAADVIAGQDMDEAAAFAVPADGAPGSGPPDGAPEPSGTPTTGTPTTGTPTAGTPAIGMAALDALLREARTQTRWTAEPVHDDTLRTLYDLTRWGPTSANCSPARLVFLRSPESRERLRPALSAGNLEKTLTAPVVAIVAYDPAFYEQLPRLFPHADARSWFGVIG